MKKQKSGISLIVLVITIIVIIILAVAVILSIANNNPIENTNKAKFQNDLKTIAEELTLKQASNYIDEHTANTVTAITIDSLSSAANYAESQKLIIKDEKLCYIPGKITEAEAKWAEEVGLESAGTLLKNGENGITILDDGTLKGPYSGSETDIIMPTTVTSVSSNAFINCNSLKNIIMLNGLTSVGSGAFVRCSALERVIFPSTLETIEMAAFSQCYSLKSVVLPYGVKSIGNGAFGQCTNLTIYTQTEELKTLVKNSGFTGTVIVDASKF